MLRGGFPVAEVLPRLLLLVPELGVRSPSPPPSDLMRRGSSPLRVGPPDGIPPHSRRLYTRMLMFSLNMRKGQWRLLNMSWLYSVVDDEQVHDAKQANDQGISP